jgi:hypothetical protein
MEFIFVGEVTGTEMESGKLRRAAADFELKAVTGIR